MQYVSTRGGAEAISATQAIVRGLAEDGGLYLPESLPRITGDKIDELGGMDYVQRACAVMKPFLKEIPPAVLESLAHVAYGSGRFDHPEVAPVSRLDEDTFLLDLWHGPTCAFKDMALQFLPGLMTESLRLTGERRKACILVATSGDTGKAALEGFADRDGAAIMVFYPQEGVSEIQRLQMTTQQGENVGVFALKGNFDDAQTAVKSIFSSPELQKKLDNLGWFFSSANSINWGRLLPQIVYYYSAYTDMVSKGYIQSGDTINICVPTGNFGNILAAYYAKRMGLPVGRLVCASNRNHILTDFIMTGRYDRRRDFYQTLSPSMDILISSNLERLLFDLARRDGAYVSAQMEELKAKGYFTLNDAGRALLDHEFSAGYCDDEETRGTIRETWREHKVLLDPHTAVAVKVSREDREDREDDAPVLVVSTASPFKFCPAVLQALGEDAPASGPELLEFMSEKTGLHVPRGLRGLRGADERFTRCLSADEMAGAVLRELEGFSRCPRD